jgi:hypothetical protein
MVANTSLTPGEAAKYTNWPKQYQETTDGELFPFGHGLSYE